MHVTRLVIEEGDRTFSLLLHPRLTVVSGVGPGARAGLVAELIGGLGSTRRGVNLEVCDDEGRRLAVLRPAIGGHRVNDLVDGSDVSDEFRGPDGRLDLLDRWGLDARRAGELLHLDRERLEAGAHRDDTVVRLAELDQTELWSAAARVRITDDELRNAVSAPDASDADADLIDQIERRHLSAEQAIISQRRLQRDAARVCACALIAAVPVAMVRPALGAPLLAIAALTALATLLFRARVARADRHEHAALAQAGADSYLGFVVNRVNELMDDTQTRKHHTAVADDHRNAAIRWTRVAGDVSVEWALAHHKEIAAAVRLRRELSTLGQLSSTAPELDDRTLDLAQSLVSHLGRLRSLGTGGESLPLILDDPFTDVDPSTKLTLVELLARSAGTPQVILLTDQDEVTSWARLEALTGEVALVEPLIASTPTRRADDLAV